jgi:hypothetical protein
MNKSSKKVYFFDKKANVKIIMGLFYALCLLLVIADFVLHRHIYVAFESIPAFYALYGFLACVLLVILAKGLRKILLRDNGYYTQDSDGTKKETSHVDR